MTTSPVLRSALAPLWVAAGLLVALSPAGRYLDPTAVLLIGVVVGAWVGGLGPGLLGALLATLAIEYYFTPPLYNLTPRLEQLPHLLAFALLAVLGGWASAARRRAEESLKKARDEMELRVRERTAELERANAALRESEERWRTAFENNPTMYFMLDAAGTILSVNPYGAEQLGYTVEELVGQPVLKVFHEADRDAVQRNAAICLEQLGRSRSWELRKVRKNGTVLWVRETARAMRTAQDESVLLIACEDITARKRAEDMVRRQANLLEQTHDAVIAWAFPGRIVYWNRGAERLYGFSSEEAAGRVTHELLRTAHPAPTDVFEAALARDGAWTGELGHTTRDGRRIVVESRQVLVREPDGGRLVLETNRDITDRKEAERTLARLNRTLQTLYQCNQALVHTTDESELLHAVCRILVDVGGLRMAWVGYRQHDTDKTIQPVAHAGHEQGYLRGINPTWSDAERTPTGTAIRTAAPCWIYDIQTDGEAAPWRAEALERGFASLLSLPLRSEGEAFGALSLYAGEPNAFSERSLEQFTELADNLAYGVTALRTREERQRAEAERDRLLLLERAARAEAETAHHRFSDLVNSIEGIVWEADAITFQFDFVSRQAERVLGYPIERWMESAFWKDHIHQDDREWAVNFCLTATAEKRDHDFEYRMIHADGHSVWLRDLVTVVVENGQASRLRGVMFDITERKRSEQALEELAGRLIHAQEEERSRLGRELHDHLTQRLGVLAIKIDQLSLDPAMAAARPSLDQLRQQTSEITDDVRGLSHRLHSTMLDYLGLVPALNRLVAEFSERHGVDVQFTPAQPMTRIPSELALCLFRVAEESLTNIAKHSGARSARVELADDADGLHLTIEDTGSGFDPKLLDEQTGLGFVSMRERLRLVQGKLQIKSAPSRGTRIDVWVPLAQLAQP